MEGRVEQLGDKETRQKVPSPTGGLPAGPLPEGKNIGVRPDRLLLQANLVDYDLVALRGIENNGSRSKSCISTL